MLVKFTVALAERAGEVHDATPDAPTLTGVAVPLKENVTVVLGVEVMLTVAVEPVHKVVGTVKAVTVG